MSSSDPKRPENVPAKAHYVPESQLWCEDTEGSIRRWYAEGQPLLQAQTRGGRLHGKVTWFTHHPDFSYGQKPREAAAELATQFQIPVGPPLTARIDATYVEGVIATASFFGFDGKGGHDALLLRASWQDGQLHGPFEWQIVTGSHVLRFGDTVIGPSDVKLPKPHPKRGLSEFVNGKRKTTTFFDSDGNPLTAPKPLKQWGQETTREMLAGYVSGGALERDLVAFFPTNKRVARLDESARQLESWIEQLPEHHRASARAFDALVRSGRFPWMGSACDVLSYGFDCVKNGLSGANDARYVGLSADGSGNLHLLDTTTGHVLGYQHEGDELGPLFDDLDSYAFAMPRIEAAAQKRIDRKKLVELFEALGFAKAVLKLI